jgi:soluble lytic murein transglycosylase
LLPQVRGHVLEPWAAYWELRARLDEATTSEVRQFLSRYAGTYQEDRLRNDWLMLLGNRRDWATFEAEQSHYRMRDDRELRCYELVLSHQKNPAGFGPESVKEVLGLWRSMLQADDGCTLAAERLLDDRKIKPLCSTSHHTSTKNRVGLSCAVDSLIERHRTCCSSCCDM